MAELNVGTVVGGLELRDRDFSRAIASATAGLASVESAAQAAGASTAQSMAPATTALGSVASEAQQATQALQAMSATPMQRIAMAANEASREIDRLQAISGNAAAADAARAALATRTAAALGQVGKQTAAATKATTDWKNVGLQSFYQVSDAASQLSAGTPFTTVLIQQGGQLLPVLASVGGALMSLAAILGPVAVAAGALGVAYAYLARDADKANAAVEANRKILEQWQAAAKSTGGVIDDDLRRQIAVANGTMTDSAAAAEKAAAAYRAQKQPLLDAAAAQVQMAQATADAIRAQIRGKAANEDTADLMLLQSDRYRKAQATVEEYRAKQQALADQIGATADVVGTLAEKEILEAQASKDATAGHKAAAKALKDHAREAKEAEAALRAFVALYEQAAEAVYARQEVPGADLFAKAQKLIEEVVPPKALSAMERFDLLAADIAAQFSRGLISQEQFDALSATLDRFQGGIALRVGIASGSMQAFNEEVQRQAIKEIRVKVTLGSAGTEKDPASEATKQAADATKAFSKSFGAKMAELPAKIVDTASKALSPAQMELDAAVRDFYSSISQKLMGNLGKLGSMISSVVQGAQTGGIWGALVAGLVELLGSSLKLERAVAHVDEWFSKAAEAFGPLIDTAHLLIANVLNALLPVFRGLTPIMQALGNAITPLAPLFVLVGNMLQILQPLLEFVAATLQPLAMVMDVVGRGLFEMVKVLQLGVGYVVYGISKAYNWIVSQLQKLLDALGIEFDIPKIKTGDMLSSLQELADQTYEGAMAQAEQNAAITESTEGFDKLNESLSNVPSGFKVAQKAFEAAAAAIYVGGVGNGGGYVTPAEGLGYGSRQTVSYGGGAQTYIPGADRGGGAVTIYIDQLDVRADDAESLVQQLSAIAGRKLFARTGSTVGSGLPYASMQVP